MNARAQRVLIWTGLVLALVYCYGYAYLMNFFPPPSPTLPAEAVAQLYAEHNMQFRVGIALMLVSGGFFLLWTLVISVQMAREENGVPICAILQALAGTLSTLIFFLPVIFWTAACFTPERDPAITALAHELGFLSFITPVCVISIQLIPIAVVALSPKKDDSLTAFPRWFGYFTLWEAIAAECGVAAVLVKQGPFAWDGLFPFYLPIIVFTAWMLTLIWTMLRAISRQKALQRAG